jgi:hypothetical protein
LAFDNLDSRKKCEFFVKRLDDYSILTAATARRPQADHMVFSRRAALQQDSKYDASYDGLGEYEGGGGDPVPPDSGRIVYADAYIVKGWFIRQWANKNRNLDVVTRQESGISKFFPGT